MKGLNEVRARIKELYDLEKRTPAQSDETAYLDSVLASQQFKDYPDTYEEEYPVPNVNVRDEYYYDLGPTLSRFWDRKIQGFYTQYGISRMDEHFGRMIREEILDPDHLEWMIRRNPHLHNVIKTNLLSNLEERKKLQN